MGKIIFWIGIGCILVCFPILSTGWGAHSQTMLLPDQRNVSVIETVQPYGLLNLNQKNSKVNYQTSATSVIFGIIFAETVFVPVILWGYYLYEPVSVKAWQHG